MEGRLIWGVNDFDEAHSPPTPTIWFALPSAHISRRRPVTCHSTKGISATRSSRVIAKEYEDGGLPFVLGENNLWFRQIAEGELRDPVHFWKKMDALPTLQGDSRSERSTLSST